jgi:hypothetical protein
VICTGIVRTENNKNFLIIENRRRKNHFIFVLNPLIISICRNGNSNSHILLFMQRKAKFGQYKNRLSTAHKTGKQLNKIGVIQ